MCLNFIFIDSTKPTSEDRRTRETIEINDRTTAKNKRESSQVTKRRSIVASLRFRSLSSTFLVTRRRSHDATKL